MQPDLARVAALIREVASAEILPRFRKLAADDIHEKQPGQLVTIADTEAERVLTRRLQDLLPGSVVVGEEGAAADPARLQAVGGAAPVWVVDPIDGTQNFAEGKPVFATMVALLRGGATVAGWIYDPVTGRMALAEAGAGAAIDGRRIHAAQAVPLEKMIGRLTSRTAKKLQGRIGGAFYLRCAGHEYVRLASGGAHFGLFRRLYPWDHAPGELLVREAGGVARCLDGTAYRPQEIEASLLLAPDAASWEALRAVIAAHAL